MDLTNAKYYGMLALVGAVIYSLLKLNLFVTQGQLEQQLRLLESQTRAEYATKQDIREIKESMILINTKLDKLNESLR